MFKLDVRDSLKRNECLKRRQAILLWHMEMPQS